MAIVGGEYLEQFEVYFQRADLDGDGRISGSEAVNFFRGSNLPRQILAQIWTHADQNHAGFLTRPAFYNALKLVTLAQSKQELTHDIVTAALYGPASAKIRAPHINLVDPSTRVQAPLAAPPLPISKQHTPTRVTSSLSSSGVPASMGSPVPEHNSWPKMTQANVQKNAKVFEEVDTDRDGKITGAQARNLFLSWNMPRDVLKQIWDLSDQDSDGMLNFREFCTALYLIERYREGGTIPSTLPDIVMFDETAFSLAGPPVIGTLKSGPTGFWPQQGLPGPHPITPVGLRPPQQLAVSQADTITQFNEQTARVPVVGKSHVINNGDDNSLDTKGQESTETSEKVENHKVLLDSKEKLLEFYRTKMQELVLYKSRCDNEIMERARADKTEVELLEKKYQEKYNQVAEIRSKLTIEEASFHEIQERKMDLHQAINKTEQGGSADGILQVRVDRIQSDVEKLSKTFTDHCKLKSSELIELPQDSTSEIPFSNIETDSIHSADVSPSEEYSENHFRRSSDGDGETRRSFVEPTWGNFDNNDDEDSPWAFNTEGFDHGKHVEKYLFG